MYSGGLRRAEVESLDLESVYLEEKFLRVKGKGAKQRLVPLGEEAFLCLTDYLQRGRTGFQSSSMSPREPESQRPH